MSNGFLPISKQDMIDEGIEQLDFVYVCGDAYVCLLYTSDAADD